MIESVFIIMLIVGFIIFMWAIEKKSYVLCILSVIFWLFIYLQSWQITVPCDQDYYEPGLSALSLLFVFIGIVFAIYYMLQTYYTNRYEEMKKEAEEKYRNLP